jgi:iron-sulfur cluster repair protein YtfE (RIC family)
MHDLAERLVAEHQVLSSWLGDVFDLAEDALDAPPRALAGRGRLAVDFLDGELLPRLAAEESSLYPALADRLGTAAIRPMVRDHEEVRRLARDIRRAVESVSSPLLPSARHELVWLLHSLHAVLSLHLAKEEEQYLPLLRRHRDVDLTDGLAADGG